MTESLSFLLVWGSFKGIHTKNPTKEIFTLHLCIQFIYIYKILPLEQLIYLCLRSLITSVILFILNFTEISLLDLQGR